MVRVAVIGSKGYLGSRVSSSLRTKGLDVLEVVRTTQFLESLQSRNLDASDQRDIVIFAAGAVRHLTQADEIRNYTSQYLDSIRESVAIAKKLGFPRFLFLSSGDVYGFDNLGRVTEKSPLNPVTPYGESRAAGEALASFLAASEGLNLLITRLFLVAGPNQPGRFLNSALSTLKSGLTFQVNRPNATRDFISVRDFSRFIELAVGRSSWEGFDEVNVCSGQGHLLLDVARQVRDFVGNGEVTGPEGWQLPIERDSLIGNPLRASTVFGWNSTMNLSEIIAASYRG